MADVFCVCVFLQLLMIPLIMSVLYVWAQLNRDMVVSFWFGTRFKVQQAFIKYSLMAISYCKYNVYIIDVYFFLNIYGFQMFSSHSISCPLGMLSTLGYTGL